jgi:hypothetical protein
MEKLLLSLSNSSGLAGLLASICVLMTCRFLFSLGEFVWKIKKEKDQLSEKTILELVAAMKANTESLKTLDHEMKALKDAFAEVPKLKLDLRRLFSATKMLAGDQWSDIRDEIMRDI